MKGKMMDDGAKMAAIEALVEQMIDDARKRGLPLPLVACEMTAMVHALTARVSIETARQYVASCLAAHGAAGRA